MIARSVLVTGATGGLGRAVVAALLARGHRVRATGRSRVAGKALAESGAAFVEADIAAPGFDATELVQGTESIVHAAALSASWGRRTDFEASNVEATRRLLAAAAVAGTRRFVFISSPSIFAGYRDRPMIGDDARPGRTLNTYARTKLEAERLVAALAPGGMAHCIIRPRALVGPGDRVILPRLADLARRPRMPLPRGGRALIELTDLRDAARAICDAEERAEQIDGAAINISGGQAVAVRTLATALAAALGFEPRLVDVPLAVLRPLAATLEAFARMTGSRTEPVLTRYTLATLGYTQTFDPAPARRLLDYAPRHDAVETLLGEARSLAAAERCA